MFDYNQAVNLMLLGGMIFLSTTVFLCLIFAIRARKLTDRIIASNMICVKITIMIVIVGIFLGEGYLIDVSLIYAMLSFTATVVFAKFVLQFRNKIKERTEHNVSGITMNKAE